MIPFEKSATWKGINDLEMAKKLIDSGILLQWREMRTLNRNFSEEQQEKIINHMAIRFVERSKQRLSAEIIIESLLIWLAATSNDRLIGCFIEGVFNQPKSGESFSALAEIVLSFEPSGTDHIKEMNSTGVLLLVETGIAVQLVATQYPDMIKSPKALIEKISSYLLSISNTTDKSTRFALVHYFGVVEKGKRRDNFNKVMTRFGLTVLESLFSLLFQKKTESIALQFLLENFGYVFDADSSVQKITFNVMRTNMLKNPERFSLFINTFSRHVHSEFWDGGSKARQTYVNHLMLLFKVSAHVGHRVLASELIRSISMLKDQQSLFLELQKIANDISIKKKFRELVESEIVMLQGEKVKNSSAVLFRSTKRGRKPSFTKAEKVGSIKQISILGATEKVS